MPLPPRSCARPVSPPRTPESRRDSAPGPPPPRGVRLARRRTCRALCWVDKHGYLHITGWSGALVETISSCTSAALMPARSSARREAPTAKAVMDPPTLRSRIPLGSTIQGSVGVKLGLLIGVGDHLSWLGAAPTGDRRACCHCLQPGWSGPSAASHSLMRPSYRCGWSPTSSSGAAGTRASSPPPEEARLRRRSGKRSRRSDGHQSLTFCNRQPGEDYKD